MLSCLLLIILFALGPKCKRGCRRGQGDCGRRDRKEKQQGEEERKNQVFFLLLFFIFFYLLDSAHQIEIRDTKEGKEGEEEIENAEPVEVNFSFCLIFSSFLLFLTELLQTEKERDERRERQFEEFMNAPDPVSEVFFYSFQVLPIFSS